MKVLKLHSRYASGDVSGENRSVVEETKQLRQAGHDVTMFSPSAESTATSRLHLGLKAVYSASAVRAVRRLILEESFDVVQIHNLVPLISPAVIRAVARLGVPIAMTLHNFRLGCLPALLFREGEICELCIGRSPWRGVGFGCYRGSRAASAAMFASIGGHRALGTFDRIDKFIAVSKFVKDKHVEMGISDDKIAVKPNATDAMKRRSGPGHAYLILSRLSPEKGVLEIMRAWRSRLGRLVVAGDGPQRAEVESSKFDGVEYVGPLGSDGVQAALLNARAVLVPSLSYDAAPRVIAEAYASGVPVVASRIGGIPERVEQGVTGFLAPPGDVGQFLDGVRALGADDVSVTMGDAALKLWERKFSPDVCNATLIDIYHHMTREASS